MRIAHTLLFGALAASLAACRSASGGGTAGAAPAPAEVEATVRALESAKWHPASIGRDSVKALFASDMLTVEYGADPMGLVYRSNVDPALLGQIYDALNATTFTLSEWRVLRPSPEVVLVSYRVTAPAMSWTAYATSTWARRDGRWQTIFYQASRAKPAQ